MTLHTYTPQKSPSQVSTSYTLNLPRYSVDKILWVKVTTAGYKGTHVDLDTMGENWKQYPWQPLTAVL